MSIASVLADSPVALTLADLARHLGTETTVPVFRLVEPSAAELAALIVPEEPAAPQE